MRGSPERRKGYWIEGQRRLSCGLVPSLPLRTGQRQIIEQGGKARNMESGIHQDHEGADRARGAEGGGMKRMHAQGMVLTETEGKAAWIKHTI